MVTSSTSYSGTAAGQTGGAAIIPGDSPRSNGPGPNVMDAATLKGDSVVNTAGEDLGKIEAIMIDVQSGRVAYAVLAYGGFLGMGSKLFAIPWSALTLDAEEKRFVLNVSKERIENAPGFDKDSWPSMADPAWATELHLYYEATPYWDDERGTPRDVRTTAGITPPMY